MKLGTGWIKKGLLLAGTFGLTFALNTSAQVQTATTTTSGESSQKVKVERGEVVAVQGNELIVKMDDGSIRHFPNVPETAKVTVEGKQLGIHDLKPGMKLQRTITTTTTPQTITTIQTVTGKVWYINPPNSVILTLENGTNQEFKIPRDQKFKVNDQMVDAFALKKGMKVTATKIVEAPTVVVTQKKSVTGKMPHVPAAPETSAAGTTQAGAPTEAAAQGTTGTIQPGPLPDAPLLIAQGEPTPAPAETATTAATPTEPAPAAESHFPWIGLGALLLVVLLAAWFIRSRSRK